MTLPGENLPFVIGWTIAVVTGYLVLRYDTRRRRLSWHAPVVGIVLTIAAAAGAKIVPEPLRYTGAFGGVMLAALLLGSVYRLKPLLTLDVAATAFAGVVAVANILTLDPAARIFLGIPEFVVFIWLWHEGRRSAQWQRPQGIVFGEYLILGGVLKVLISGIILRRLAIGEIRPAYIDAAISISVGTILLAAIVPRFLRTREEHRIVADVSAAGTSFQPEYAPPTPECPRPELWKMYDSMTAEVEVLDFLKSLVITVKPHLVVETGTFMGVSTLAIAEGLKQNGFGRVITVEYDPQVFEKAKERIADSGLAAWIDARNQSSLDLHVGGPIDLLFSDSDVNIREREVRHFLPQISPTGLILIHDASSHQRVVREAALRLELEGLISVVLIPTPRGLVMAQKRPGRK
jgi:predicted O-methyltransferase YrrM